MSRRLLALIKKETYQIIRDPSSIMIAFVLPLLLLFLFGYGLSLDVNHIKIGIALEDSGESARKLANNFHGGDHFDVHGALSRQQLIPLLTTGDIKTLLIIPDGFSSALYSGRTAMLSILTDGSFPNSAAIAQNHVLLAIAQWSSSSSSSAGAPIKLEPRFWYNSMMESRHAIIPGIMAMIMALIGTMLTALVIAREWERGSMEALLSTPVSGMEILLGKLIPYYLLAMLSTFMSLGISVFLFHVPFRGSVIVLFLVGSLFMLSALGQGLIISTLTKNQYAASFAALLSAFLPVVLLSGFLYEISSMPLPQRIIAAILPARYLVTCLQTLFLAGDVWGILIPNMIKLAIIGVVLLGATLKNTRKQLG